MKRLMILTTAFALSASMAMAAMSANDLVTAYQAKGYTRIEVTTGLTQTKVEASRGSFRVEVVYDTATGAILKQETGWAGRKDRGTGIDLSTTAQDFVDDHSMGNDDASGPDSNDDHGNDGKDDGPRHDSRDHSGGDDGKSGHAKHDHDD